MSTAHILHGQTNANDATAAAGCMWWAPSDTWLTKPLCRRYTFAALKTLRLPVCHRDSVKHLHWHWALGLLKQGQYEVLGAWPGEAMSALVASDLHRRGVVHIGAVSSEGAADFASRYPETASWPSSDEDVQGFGAGRRAALQAAAATAERLQASIARTIKRRGPFADESAASDYLVQALQKADRRF
jgi:transposase-like protein